MLALALSCLLLTATATDISEILLDLPYDLPDSYAPRTVKVPSVRHAHRMLVQTGILPVSAADPPFAGSPADSGDTSDGQIEVSDTLQQPFAGIGEIRTTDSNGTSIGLCSGALISVNPPVVLSAGHCWWDQASGTANAAGVWVPAYNPLSTTPAPYGSANIIGAKVPSLFVDTPASGYYSAGADAYDVSLLFLDAPATPLSLPIGYLDQLNGLPETLETAGYPGDKCLNQSSDFFQCPMWYTSCPMSTYLDTNATGTDSCFSGEGQSGSPIWLEAPDMPAELVVTGILTSAPEDNTLVAPDGETPTLYVEITAALFNNLTAWIGDGLNQTSVGAETFTASNIDTMLTQDS